MLTYSMSYKPLPEASRFEGFCGLCLDAFELIANGGSCLNLFLMFLSARSTLDHVESLWPHLLKNAMAWLPSWIMFRSVCQFSLAVGQGI